eukprot:8227954-Lingulodinium_polyedra.AAC.1
MRCRPLPAAGYAAVVVPASRRASGIGSPFLRTNVRPGGRCCTATVTARWKTRLSLGQRKAP